MIDGDDRVPAWLRDVDAEIRVSRASIWEIAIKSSLGRLDVADDLPEQLDSFGVNWLEIEPGHVWAVRSLPHHHGDPFDRLLIAQALGEGLIVATNDSKFSEYGVPVRWA